MTSPNATRGVIVTVAIICAAVAWPLASVLSQGILSVWGAPSQTILPMLAAGALAGFIVGIATASRSRSAMRVSGDAPTRAGFLASFIAASLLVTRATILHGRAGHVTDAGLSTLLAAVVTILPGTLFAMFMGGLGRAVRLAFDADPADGEPAFTFRPIHALYAGCVLALLSPFIPGLFSEPPPPKPVVVATPTPTPEPKLVFTPPPKPTPPPKIYEKPQGFDSADATRITVVTQRTLADVDAGKPMLFSPDGKRIALYRDGESFRGLVVFDLETFTESSRLTFDTAATALAWSPDSERIAGVFERGDSRFVAVFDPVHRRLIGLPQPDGEEIPKGNISWPDANEIVVHSDSGSPSALNLDTLELRPLEDADFFKALDDAQKQSVKSPAPPALPKSLKWVLEMKWPLQVVVPRLAKENFGFRLGSPGVVSADPERWVRRHIPDIPNLTEGRFLFSPDATKVVVVRDRVATFAYLGLREATKTVRALDMKRKLEDFPQADALKKALDEKQLAAFVFAPFTNPLTDRVVGADYRKVKAIIRFNSWTGTLADAWIQDEFAPVESSDVVSGLHVAKESGPVPIGNKGRRAWWAVLGDNGDSRLSLIPPKKDVPLSEVGSPIELRTDGQNVFRATPAKSPGNSTPAASPPPIFPAAALPPIFESRPAPAAFQQKQIRPANPKVVGFINFHHQKSSDRNINGLLDDYADQVESFQSGVVDRAFLRDAEEKYHAPGHTVFEKVVGEIRETLIAPDRIRVEYPLQFVRIKPDTSWTKGVSDVTLEIQVTPNGLRIVKQNSISREREKFRGKGAPPPL